MYTQTYTLLAHAHQGIITYHGTQVLYTTVMCSLIHTAKIYGVPTDEQRKLIAKQVKNKWLLIGIHLGVDQAELEQISHDCGSDNYLRSSELFRKWAAQELSSSHPFTWKGVIEALDNRVVKESPFARKLESTYL